MCLVWDSRIQVKSFAFSYGINPWDKIKSVLIDLLLTEFKWRLFYERLRYDTHITEWISRSTNTTLTLLLSLEHITCDSYFRPNDRLFTRHQHQQSPSLSSQGCHCGDLVVNTETTQISWVPSVDDGKKSEWLLVRKQETAKRFEAITSHVENMITSVTGFQYKVRAVYTHFPSSVCFRMTDPRD